MRSSSNFHKTLKKNQYELERVSLQKLDQIDKVFNIVNNICLLFKQKIPNKYTLINYVNHAKSSLKSIVKNNFNSFHKYTYNFFHLNQL